MSHKVVNYRLKNTGDASVLFSGGSDSTLAAAWCCGNFKRVHLLTFHHSGMRFIEKSGTNVDRLKQKFGKERVTHHLSNIEEPFQRIYYSDYLHDLKRYGTFLAAGTCNICQLAMHVQTITYDVEHGISFACDGYKQEKKHIYIIMSKEGVQLLKDLYGRYGIEYENPVYDTLRTDWELYDRGITSKRDVKFPYERLHYAAQHSCFHGILTNAYILGYHYPLHLETSSRWHEYFERKIEVAEEYLDEKVGGRVPI